MESQEVFVARQPIFDVRKKVYGYELLFRSEQSKEASFKNGTSATTNVISNAFLSIGIDQVTGNRPAFINFTRDLIMDESALVLPPEKTIVEILEDVEPDQELLEAVRKIKDKGYRIALDDVVSTAKYEKLIKLTDIVKVDFLLTTPEERRALVKKLRKIAPGLRLLAEKVEDHDEFVEGKNLGFQYFQGYFFSKPLLMSRKELTGFKISYLKILQTIYDLNLNYDEIEKIIKTDVSLTTKLLRYINAAAFPWHKRIESVKRALVLLGETQVRNWVSIVALSELVQDKPQELAVLSAIRGRFCETAGEHSGYGFTQLETFMCGILSLLDAMLDVSLEEALTNIPVSPEVKEALLGGGNELAQLLSLAIAYEKGEWDRVPKLCQELDINESVLPGIYAGALEWSVLIFDF